MRSRIAARSCAGSGSSIAALGGVDRAPRLVGAALRNPSDERAVVRRPHLEPLAGLDPLAVDEKLALGRGGGHAVSVDGGRRSSLYALVRWRRPRIIVDAVRSPIGQPQRLAGRHPRRRARRAGAERARRARRPRSGRDRGRADGLRHAGRRAGAQRRARRGARRRLAGDRLRDRRSTASAARRCRPRSTPPRRSRRVTSTSSSPPASST